MSNSLSNRIADRYDVLEMLGSGGMGAVYRGLDIQTNQYVAIKLLKVELSNDFDGVERFAREAEALRQLNHPNIVKVFATHQENNQHFIIMEYVSGGTLGHLLQKQRLPIDRVLAIGLELSDALARAHHLRIVHRDIKPANVLLAEDGTPRLTDFGVARLETAERLTQTGVAVGTLDYMPPESVNGDPIDHRADIWSFGVMLYEMIAGERPFRGETSMKLIMNIMSQAPTDLKQHRSDVPMRLNALIEKMLQKKKEDRLGSMRAIGAELETLSNNYANAFRLPNTQSLVVTPNTAILPEANVIASPAPASDDVDDEDDSAVHPMNFVTSPPKPRQTEEGMLQVFVRLLIRIGELLSLQPLTSGKMQASDWAGYLGLAVTFGVLLFILIRVVMSILGH